MKLRNRGLGSLVNEAQKPWLTFIRTGMNLSVPKIKWYFLETKLGWCCFDRPKCCIVICVKVALPRKYEDFTVFMLVILLEYFLVLKIRRFHLCD